MEQAARCAVEDTPEVIGQIVVGLFVGATAIGSALLLGGILLLASLLGRRARVRARLLPIGIGTFLVAFGLTGVVEVLLAIH
jgi:hypothetical protein